MADISITAANVLKSTAGIPLQGTAAVAITQGQYIYQLANGNYGLADSNGTPPANSCAGVALNSASAGQPVTFVAIDPSLTTGGTLTSGAVAYLSDNPGSLTTAYADILSGSTVIMLGVTNTDGTLNLKPTVGGTK